MPITNLQDASIGRFYSHAKLSDSVAGTPASELVIILLTK